MFSFKDKLLMLHHRQWSWPLWLPVQFFGIFPNSILVDNDSSAPWSEDLEQKLFSSAVGEPPLHHRERRASLSISLQAYTEYWQTELGNHCGPMTDSIYCIVVDAA